MWNCSSEQYILYTAEKYMQYVFASFSRFGEIMLVMTSSFYPCGSYSNSVCHFLQSWLWGSVAIRMISVCCLTTFGVPSPFLFFYFILEPVQVLVCKFDHLLQYPKSLVSFIDWAWKIWLSLKQLYNWCWYGLSI